MCFLTSIVTWKNIYNIFFLIFFPFLNYFSWYLLIYLLVLFNVFPNVAIILWCHLKMKKIPNVPWHCWTCFPTSLLSFVVLYWPLSFNFPPWHPLTYFLPLHHFSIVLTIPSFPIIFLSFHHCSHHFIISWCFHITPLEIFSLFLTFPKLGCDVLWTRKML